MLQRTSLLEKRKKKKAEYEKLLMIIKNKVEMDLKHQNKKSDDDFIDLEKLDPIISKFFVTDVVKNFTPKAVTFLNDYVTTNNEYINVKALEDRTKVIKISFKSIFRPSVKKEEMIRNLRLCQIIQQSRKRWLTKQSLLSQILLNPQSKEGFSPLLGSQLMNQIRINLKIPRLTHQINLLHSKCRKGLTLHREQTKSINNSCQSVST